MRKITDPNSISKLTLSLLQNNVLSKKMLLILKVIEGFLIVFYSLVIQQQMLRALKQDYTKQKTIEAEEETIEIHLSFDFFLKYQDMMIDSDNVISVITIGLTVFLFIILIFFLIQIYTHATSTLNELKHSKLSKKCLGVIFVLLGQILYIPFTDLIVRSIMHDYDMSLGMFIGLQITNAFCLLLLFFFVLYQKRLFKLNIPSEDVWGSPNSNAIYFGIIAHLIVPIILAIDQHGKYIYIEVIATLIIQIIYTIMIIMLPHTFDQLKSKIQKVSQVIVVLILEISVIQYIFKDLESKEGIYFLFLIFFQGYMILKIDEQVKKHYLVKFKQGKIKMELEYEYVLLNLLEISQNFLNENNNLNKENHQQVLKLLEFHQMTCQDITCFCNYSEQFMDIFKESESQQSNIFILDAQEFKKLKIIIQNKHNLQIKSSIQNIRLEQFQQQQQQEESKNDQSINMNDIKYEEHDNLDLTAQRLNKKKRSGYKVELQQMRQKFVSHLFLIFFRQINNKFPQSLRINQLFNYYSAFIVQNPQLCLSSLRSSNDKNLSWLNKVSKFVNEYYILSKLQMIQQNKAVNKKSIDGEYYIKVNQLYDQYTSEIEQLANTTIAYWQGYLQEELSPINIYETGVKLAKDVQQLYVTFKELEKTLIMKDYKIYYWFAKVQEKIINDQGGYNIFLNKMRSVIQLNQVYAQNTKFQFSQEKTGFVVVDAHQQNYGKILFLNKNMAMMLNKQYESIKYFNINEIMPKLIEEKHDKFMKNYNDTGTSVMLNKKLLNFIKGKKGVLQPVDVFVKFHYSAMYRYCFIGLIQPVETLVPFKDFLQYDVKQLVFMSVNIEEGLIYEVSENFISLLKHANIHYFKDIREISFTEKKHTIQEMFRNFHFEEVIHQLRMASKYERVYESVLEVDFNSYNDNLDWGQTYYNNEHVIDMRVAIYYESYGNGSLELCYVVMSHVNAMKIQQMGDTAFKSNLDLEVDDEEFKFNNQLNDGSSTGSTASHSVQSLEQFHSFYQQNTPKILKVVIQLVILMFLVSFSIATINLGLNIKNQQRNAFEIYTTRSSIDRINSQTSIRCIIRTLINIANGYEPNSTNEVHDRWTVYKDLLNQKIDSLKKDQNYLENSGYEFTDEFQKLEDSNVLQLFMVNTKNEIMSQDVTMNIGQNLLGSRLTQIGDSDFNGFKGNLTIQKLNGITANTYLPKQSEQDLYFIVVNMNGAFREYNRVFTNSYIKDINTHADNNLQQAMITTIISIITIFVVALIVSPIISLTEERKFKALNFFLKIPKQQIQIYKDQCNECIELLEEQYEKPSKSKELHIDNNSVGGLENQQSLNVNPFYNPINGIEEISMFESAAFIAENFGSPNSSRFPMRHFSSNLGFQTYRTFKETLQHSGIEEAEREEEEDRNPHSLMNIPKLSASDMVYDIGIQRITEHDEHDEHDDHELEDRKEEQQYKEEDSVSDSKRSHDLLKQQSKIEDANEKDNKKQQSNQEVAEEHSQELENHYAIINKLAFRQKMRAFLAVIIIIAIFSIYFIISFLMTRAIYINASQAAEDMNTIYLKESCFENIMAFVRENQIRNTSLLLTEDNKTDAASYFLTQCLNNEEQYNNLRKNFPNYLEAAGQYLSSLESNHFCENVFNGEHQQYVSQCENDLDGLLDKGITYFLSYMYSHSQKLIMQFQAATKVRQRNSTFLLKAMNDTQTIRILDAKLTLLNHMFEDLKEITQDSIINYFAKLLNQLIIVYAIFVLILIATIIYFTIYAFKKIKKVMWNTNLLLRIIPTEILQKDDQQSLRAFFVN